MRTRMTLGKVCVDPYESSRQQDVKHSLKQSTGLVIKWLTGSLKSAVRWDSSAFVSVEAPRLLINEDMFEERATLY